MEGLMGVKIALSRRESGVADFRGGFGSGGVGPSELFHMKRCSGAAADGT